MQGVFPQQAYPVTTQSYGAKNSANAREPRAPQSGRAESRPDLNGSRAANTSRSDMTFAAYLGEQVRSMGRGPISPANAKSPVSKTDTVGNMPSLIGRFDGLKSLIYSLLTKHLKGNVGETIARTVDENLVPCSVDESISGCREEFSDLSALAGLLPNNCRLRELLENVALGKDSDSLPQLQRLQGAFRDLAMLYRRLMINGKTEIQNSSAPAAISAGAQTDGEHAGQLNPLGGLHFIPGSIERHSRGAIDSSWNTATGASSADSIWQISQVAESLVRELKQALGETDPGPLTVPYLSAKPLSELRGSEGSQMAIPLDFAQMDPTDGRLEVLRQAQNAMHDLLDRMRGTVVLDPGAKDALVRLDPPTLGRLQIQMQVDDSQRVVAVIRSSNPETQAFLDQNKEELRRGLSDQGFDMDQSEIRIGTMDEELFLAEVAGSISRRI